MRWSEIPEWASDAVYTDTVVHFGWRDRIRILFGKPLEIRAKTVCENKPGRTESGGDRIHIDKIVPRFWKRTQMGMAESEPKLVPE